MRGVCSRARAAIRSVTCKSGARFDADEIMEWLQGKLEFAQLQVSCVGEHMWRASMCMRGVSMCGMPPCASAG
eukprot:103597-Chlamydomonas_euryale.AAC.5